MPAVLPSPRLLTDGLTMVESGRWHEGRLWLAHWGSGEVIAVDLEGRRAVVGPGRDGMGWSIAWLPDGRLLVSGAELTRVEPDGSAVRHSPQGGNELVVAPAGHVYVNGADFDFLGGGAPKPGWIRLIGPDGAARDVAGDLEFPNGMVVTPDGSTLVVAESFAGRLSAFDIAADGTLSGRRTWAEGLGPEGICIDPDGGIWCQTADTHSDSGPAGAVVRVLDGGEITHRVETDLPCFSCALGGPAGRHLFLLCNEFEGVDQLEAVLARRSARVYVTDVPE
ncbi:SMP-30/gluconolactonase/LRE family protein [Actinokineospora iranica]|uniref:Sugar lactone lactonase YvrE n=1 Tax=Actinokineospora iranica TaxID=1271860 RepID=A0A1G6PPC0_9PSEU|nr:SMP-30/gluconolactonase/LRE family protein [Actinokineospora iranica]SDC81225.1 Sugar lactone lactonase YvrE [Actinokineospora iranica]